MRASDSEFDRWPDDGVAVSSGPRWFAVMTHAQREPLALQHLRRQGFEAWLPQRLKTVRHAHRNEVKPRPLFPRYLFVRFNPAAARWRSINGTFGVARLVSFGDQPAPVPAGVVEGLLAIAGSDGVVRFGSAMQPGDRVQLASGPFAEEIGTIVRLDGTGAVHVLLDIMGRRVKAHSRPGQILPAA